MLQPPTTSFLRFSPPVRRVGGVAVHLHREDEPHRVAGLRPGQEHPGDLDPGRDPGGVVVEQGFVEVGEEPDLLFGLAGDERRDHRFDADVASPVAFDAHPRSGLLTEQVARARRDREADEGTILGGDVPVAAFGGGVGPLQGIRRFVAADHVVGHEAERAQIEHRADHAAGGAVQRVEHDHRAARVGPGEELRLGEESGDDAAGRRGDGALHEMEGVAPEVGGDLIVRGGEAALADGHPAGRELVDEFEFALCGVPRERHDLVLKRRHAVGGEVDAFGMGDARRLELGKHVLGRADVARRGLPPFDRGEFDGAAEEALAVDLFQEFFVSLFHIVIQPQWISSMRSMARRARSMSSTGRSTSGLPSRSASRIFSSVTSFISAQQGRGSSS